MGAGPRTAREIEELRENRRYLAGFRLPECVVVSNDLGETLAGADAAISVVPSRYLRGVMEAAARNTPGNAVVSATKGIEEETLCRMSQVVGQSGAGTGGGDVGADVREGDRAGEPRRGDASEETELAEEIQRAFADAGITLLCEPGCSGVEVGAALKM